MVLDSIVVAPMKPAWDAKLPHVKVQVGKEPKAVKLILPYYDNPAFFRRQLKGWHRYPSDVLRHLSLIVVDDGSPKYPLEDELQDLALPFSARSFRIEVDKRWNWLAARNIGAYHAGHGWMVLTDMDHVLPVETAKALIYGVHDDKVIYGFTRVEHTGERIAAHPNSWFLTKEMFWRVGGYDETLSGHYGTDGDWRRRMAAVAPIEILADHLERHEHIGDSSTTAYLRKQPEDAAVKGLISQRRPGWKPRTLSFPYHEIALQGVPCRAR